MGVLRGGVTLAGCVLLLGVPAQAADIKAADIKVRVKEIVTERCSLCHGVDGEAATSVYPRLAAQNEVYVVKQLKDFRDGRRKGTMNEMAKDLSDAWTGASCR